MSSPISKPKKKKRQVYRISIIYHQSCLGRKCESAFAKALTKEDAEQFIVEQINAVLKMNRLPINCFKVETKLSSQEEVEFYTANINNRSYSGVLN